MLLLLLFPSSLVIPSPWYSYSSFHDTLFFMFLLWCSCLCFPTYQSHNSCNPLPLPPISWSFNYEVWGCIRAKICPFVHCLAIVACLPAHCAYVVNPRFALQYPRFCGRCFLHILLLLQIRLHQIGPLHTNWLLVMWLTILQPPPLLFF